MAEVFVFADPDTSKSSGTAKGIADKSEGSLWECTTVSNDLFFARISFSTSPCTDAMIRPSSSPSAASREQKSPARFSSLSFPPSQVAHCVNHSTDNSPKKLPELRGPFFESLERGMNPDVTRSVWQKVLSEPRSWLTFPVLKSSSCVFVPAFAVEAASVIARC